MFRKNSTAECVEKAKQINLNGLLSFLLKPKRKKFDTPKNDALKNNELCSNCVCVCVCLRNCVFVEERNLRERCGV